VPEHAEVSAIRDILRRGIRRSVADQDGITPGGVLAFADSAPAPGPAVTTISFGYSHFGPENEVFEVAADTVYDLASLTKPMATAATLMKLDVDLDAPVAAIVPELSAACGGELGRAAERITFAQLLGHASGLPAHLEFFHRLRAGERAGAPSRREALLRMAAGTPLAHAPGERAVYSDLGYIVLGFAIERITGMRLDQAVRAHVTEPLGMRHTFYVDLDDPARVPAGQVVHTPGGLPVRVAPTEVCPYRGLVHAEVHDDNAHAGGGIFGHAGLFGPAGDVARFAGAMVQAAAGQAVAGFEPAVVRRFFTTRSAPDTTWRLGWDTPSTTPGVSHAGDAWPRTGVGHLGFTGTCMWLDPERGRFAVLLTNRVHPSRAHQGIRELRRAVMDAVVHHLDGRG
jgi:CubicO group peptidase (beta-lactamase class C family)